METRTDVMMRECSVRLERCEFMGNDMKTEIGLVEPHEVRLQNPTATTPAILSYACNQTENDNEPSMVVVKIEYDNEVCFSAGDRELKLEQLRQDCLSHTPMDSVQECDIIIKKEDEMCKVIKQELCIDATVLLRTGVPAEVENYGVPVGDAGVQTQVYALNGADRIWVHPFQMLVLNGGSFQ
ncbi:hypothetical protein EVAR_39639_1 [Eumeta japonica]|uniref:Uncharacterized protein n=1 Tax=Eumeta variegata TaxID=151549 RepID=A0A4C1WFY3_EUMVA|nr:hypothetical protein EVAR_39639_1 [Eumeta japonica]